MSRILLLEDEVGFQHMLKSVLDVFGHEVTVCREGQEALDFLRGERYDLLIFDHFLPDMTGIECLEKIREQHIETPVILMTAVPQWNTVADAIRLNAVDFLQKPFGVADEFLPAVNHCLSKTGN
ncbi:MAG TPA: response regulator [Anaerolineales bacterium]|nr:response regulator [Anaerolineales bacterium]